MKRRRWTPAEDEALRRRYPEGVTADLARDLGRTQKSISRRAQALGLVQTPAAHARQRAGARAAITAESCRVWTERELGILRRFYPRTPTQELANWLGRTMAAVHERARLAGLKKTAAARAHQLAQARRNSITNAPLPIKRAHQARCVLVRHINRIAKEEGAWPET